MQQLPYPPSHPTTRDQFPVTGPGAIPSLWYRIGARLFDGLVIAIPSLVVMLAYIDLNSTESIEDPFGSVPFGVKVALVVGPLIYEFVFLAIAGATPGKMLLGLRVVRFADAGRPAPYQLGIRLLAANIVALIGLGNLPDGLINILSIVQPMVYFSAAFHPLMRGFHDLGAGTIVLRTR